MEELFKWAIDTISKWQPIPVPNLLAALILGLIVLGLWRKVHRSRDEGEAAPLPKIATDWPWVTSQIINNDRNIQELNRLLRMPDGTSRLDDLTRKVNDIHRMLRRRHGRSKKLISDDDLGESAPG